MIIVGSSGDEDDARQQRGRGGAPPRPAQQPLSTDLANIVNAATSANNPRHPADLVRTRKRSSACWNTFSILAHCSKHRAFYQASCSRTSWK